ncbi:sigma-E processing peptidase SpoIIGA [Paenibacillus motobuensis]|uniref:sigma-E processing peptidase SpoIIGA n=1 Tax=Paenibacillus TaxID=44249 RepID=UPI00203C9B9A|nr:MULTISPECIES: sigma-E processing peptidase SpoIIGA [Paenibacillus]MCM3040456.1 sigma-E processing peptidase SpoIIGA [Paenibacillus lutimineralis]MCM3647560.1 sigma-E processing peptidase SpoIIGA [Paenibacillus motobuensis]
MVVYIDLIFLLNLLIDASLLLVTAWMRKQKIVLWRLAASAAFGAAYVVMMFLPELSFLYTFLVKFLFSVAMLWIAFGFKSLQSYLRNLGAFYMINFVAAGGILGIHYLLQSYGEVFNGIWYSTSGGLSFSMKVGTLFMIIAFIAVLLWFRGVMSARRRLERIDTCLAEVTVRIDDTTIHCTGLIDTGNQLNDPFSRLPVMVMEASLWEQYLPDTSGSRWSMENADNLILTWSDDEGFLWRDRLRLIPYRAVGKGTQFMIALKPDEVCVITEGNKVVTTRVLIGLDGGVLSTDGVYRAIIHPALTEGKQSDESPVKAAGPDEMRTNSAG